MQHMIITGASSGIGRAIAIRASKLGYKLSICGRNPIKLADTLRRLKCTDSVFSEHFCMTDIKSIESFCKRAIEYNGHTHVLINCAGLNNVRKSSLDTSISELDWLMKVNCYAPIACSQNIIPSMVANGGGTIVNVLSTVCLFSNPGIAAYTASKAAYDAFSKVMRKEIKPHGIKLLSVYPGGVDTDFRAASRPNYLAADDVAEAILAQLNSGPKTHIHELVLRPQSEDNF